MEGFTRSKMNRLRHLGYKIHRLLVGYLLVNQGSKLSGAIWWRRGLILSLLACFRGISLIGEHLWNRGIFLHLRALKIFRNKRCGALRYKLTLLILVWKGFHKRSQVKLNRLRFLHQNSYLIQKPRMWLEKHTEAYPKIRVPVSRTYSNNISIIPNCSPCGLLAVVARELLTMDLQMWYQNKLFKIISHLSQVQTPP
jgi:hypothetical protein